MKIDRRKFTTIGAGFAAMFACGVDAVAEEPKPDKPIRNEFRGATITYSRVDSLEELQKLQDEAPKLGREVISPIRKAEMFYSERQETMVPDSNTFTTFNEAGEGMNGRDLLIILHRGGDEILMMYDEVKPR